MQYNTTDIIAHIDDFLHVIPSKLLIADETLNMSDWKRKNCSALKKAVLSTGPKSGKMLAETLEKKIATVVIFA